MFLSTFQTVFNAIFQLFLISLAAGLLVRKKIVSQSQIQSLSAITVSVFLPCLIVVKTVTRFDPSGFDLWWILPLAGALFVIVGLGLASLLFRMRPEKRLLLPMASMQNAVYIVLPIGQLLYPDQFDLLAMYCFLLILGQSPLMWSLGKVLITGRSDASMKLRDFITPPLVATVTSIGLVLTGISSFFPVTLLNAMDLLGQATVPLAVFILGATLGSISLADMPPVVDTVKVTAVKFFLVPLTAFGILYFSKLYQTLPLFSSLMIIQAAAPPATNLILMVKNYGGDSQVIGSMMLLQYLVCLVAMPLWLSLWTLTVG